MVVTSQRTRETFPKDGMVNTRCILERDKEAAEDAVRPASFGAQFDAKLLRDAKYRVACFENIGEDFGPGAGWDGGMNLS